VRATYKEVLGVNVVVLGLKVLLSHENTLTEEILVDLLALGLGDEHVGGWCVVKSKGEMKMSLGVNEGVAASIEYSQVRRDY
jgi:hypothetical protein